MDKAGIKAFMIWLETASEDQLAQHKEFILARAGMITTREGKADLRLALRLLEEEVLARIQSARHG
jgi:hypothetical protein